MMTKMEHEMSYVAITPVKNEEAYIAQTLESMVSQRVKPVEWVIVDDGSKDRTPQIVEEYCAQHPWIRLLRLPGSPRVRGGHIVGLFYKGLSAARASTCDYIVKLDGDLSFEPDFFERLLQHMEMNPGLGITSGVSYLRSGSGLMEERSARGHTLGACKVYRRRCFDEIGGLMPAMGWDGIDEIKAQMRDWGAEPVPGLKVIHLRPEGAAKGAFKSGMERGRGSWFMGYHPLFFLVRAAKCALRSPLDGIGMTIGYFRALFKRDARIDDPEFIRYLRQSQIKRLLLLRNRV